MRSGQSLRVLPMDPQAAHGLAVAMRASQELLRRASNTRLGGWPSPQGPWFSNILCINNLGNLPEMRVLVPVPWRVCPLS